MNFTDKYGRFHYKPCISGEPSSNNAWIYTAECKAVGVPIDEVKILECFKQSLTSFGFDRNPNQILPAVSHDEALAIPYLLPDSEVVKNEINGWERNHWQICNLRDFKPKPFLSLDWLGIVSDFYKVYKLGKLYEKTGGKEGLQNRHAIPHYPSTWYVAFYMNGWKRYLIKRHAGKSPTAYETFSFLTSKLFTVFFSKSNSSLRLLGFQLLMLKNKTIVEKLISKLYNKKHNLKKIAANEYNSEHPILKKL
jgi:hypothetical protein